MSTAPEPAAQSHETKFGHPLSIFGIAAILLIFFGGCAVIAFVPGAGDKISGPMMMAIPFVAGLAGNGVMQHSMNERAAMDVDPPPVVAAPAVGAAA